MLVMSAVFEQVVAMDRGLKRSLLCKTFFSYRKPLSAARAPVVNRKAFVGPFQNFYVLKKTEVEFGVRELFTAVEAGPSPVDASDAEKSLC